MKAIFSGEYRVGTVSILYTPLAGKFYRSLVRLCTGVDEENFVEAAGIHEHLSKIDLRLRIVEVRDVNK